MIARCSSARGWRNTDRTSWGANRDHRRCGSSPPHTGGNRSLFTRLRLSSEPTTASDDPKQYADFVISMLMDSASKSPLRMNRLCYDEAHVLAAKITPITVPYSLQRRWCVSRLRLHTKYLSENWKPQRCLYSGRTPCAANRHFQRPSEDDHRGGTDVVRTVNQAHQCCTLKRQTTWQNYNLSCTPLVTLTPAHLQNHASGTDVSIYEKLPSSSDAFNAQCLEIRPLLVNSATLFMDTDCCVCYEPMDDRVASPLLLRRWFSPFSAAASYQRNCAKMSYLHSLSDRYRVVEGSYKDRHLPHGGRQNALNFTLPSTRWPTQDQRRTRRLR
jgi:hypothetical protein